MFNALKAIVVRIPTLLAFAMLAGLAYWGHHTGWKFPSLAAMRGLATAEKKEDWCTEHGVPNSRCIACNPALGGADPKDWCKEHGVPESRCTTCHPEILTGKKVVDWCREHGVPESQCNVCHPEIVVKGEVTEVPQVQVTSTGDDRTTHDPLGCQNHVRRVQFASLESVRKAGIQLAKLEERPMPATLLANGEITYDQTRIARVSTRASGTVVLVKKAVGQPVRRGEVLAVVDAAEVGRAKAEILQAAAQVNLKSKAADRLKTATREGYRATAELQEAEAAVREARIRMLNAQQALSNLGLQVAIPEVTAVSDLALAEKMRLVGLPAELSKELSATTWSANLIPVAAPLDGVVTARDVVAGEVVDTARALFTIVDTRRMWVLLDVRSEDSRRIAIGQPVRFEPDGARDEPVLGRLSWISTAVDEKTRTLRVRAEVDNAKGALRASTFGAGRIVVRENPQAVVVPEEALQWEGCSNVVFVRLADDIFQTRKVKLGTRSGGFAEALAGVAAGEVVVTVGSHVLKSEVLKASMGAGCVDD